MIHRSLVYEFEYKRFVFLKHLKIIFLSFMLVVISLFSIKLIINAIEYFSFNDGQFSYMARDEDGGYATVTKYVGDKNKIHITIPKNVSYVDEGFFWDSTYNYTVSLLGSSLSPLFPSDNHVEYLEIKGNPGFYTNCFGGLNKLKEFKANDYEYFDLKMLRGLDSLEKVYLDNITHFYRDPENMVKIPAESLNYKQNYKIITGGISPVIRLGKAELEKGTDYDLDDIYTDEPKTFSVRAIMKGNFKGELPMEINIVTDKFLDDSNADIEVEKIEKIYDGTPWSLDDLGNIEVNVTDESGTTVALYENNNQNQDGYELVLPEGENVGTYDLMFKFHGQYYGNKINKKLFIRQRNLEESDLDININNEEKSYDGKAWTPEDITVKLKENNELLKQFSEDDNEADDDYDYKVVMPDDASAGAKDVYFIFCNNYSGTFKKILVIKPKELTESDVILESTEKQYDGQAWTKDDIGKVMFGETELVEGQDYDITLPINPNVGAEIATLIFKGNYSGIVTKTLNIKSNDLTESDVDIDLKEKEYGSKWGVDDIEKVMFGDKELVEGQDYTVAFNDDLDIDSQNAIFTFKGNYSGTVTKALPTKPRDLSNENVIVNANPSTKEYDGYEWSPSFSIIFNGKEIPSDSYSIELPNNRVDAGIKRVKITFKGNYTGTITRDFEITQNQLPKIDIIPDSEWKEYDGNVWNPSFRVAINGEELGEENGDFYIEYPDDMVNAGDKEIKFVFSKKFKGEVTKTLEIEQKDFNSLTIETEDRHIYDGNVWSPSIVVKDGENVLKENEDYTVTLSTNMISEGEKLLILDFKNYSGNYMKKLKIESWGTPKTMHSPDGNRITNYVRSNGETSVEITDFGKVWLHEESNGSGTWYCLDNSKGIFEKGSKLTIKWLTFGDNEHSNKLKDVDDQTALTNNMKLFDISVTSPDGKKYTYLNDTVDLYIELGGNWNRNNISGLFVGAGEDEIIPTKFITLNTLDGEKEFARMSLKHFSTYLVFDNPATSESKSSSGISENKDSDKSKDTKLAEVRNLSDEIQTEPQSEQESNLENPESVSSEFKESEPVKSTESENILDSSLSHKTENSYNETESSSNTQVSQDHVGEEHGINDNVDDQQIFYDNDRIENNATPNENEIESNKVEDNIVPDEAENESENKELDDIPRYQNPSTNYDVSLGRAQDNHSTIALLFSFLCIASLARRFNLRIH